jgi:hypothetical protein
MLRKKQGKIISKSPGKITVGKGVAFSLCLLMAFASTPLLAMHAPEQQNHNPPNLINNMELGSNIQCMGLKWIGTKHFTKTSPGGHTEIIMKISSYYNLSERYILYCICTIVDAMNGSNIEAGSAAIGSGSTIFQSIYSPTSLYTHESYEKVSHPRVIYGHRVMTDCYIPVTIGQIEKGKLTPNNVSGSIFYTNGQLEGNPIHSSAGSYNFYVSGDSLGISVGSGISFFRNTCYSTSKIYVTGNRSQQIQWKRDDCVQGLTYTHFVTIASAFYAAGSNPSIHIETIANTTYGGHFVYYYPFSSINYSTLNLSLQYFPFNNSN